MRTKKYQITKNKLRLQVGHIEYIVGWVGGRTDAAFSVGIQPEASVA
jgi:hypothetical protein